MKTLLTLFVGIVIGFGLASFTGKTEKKMVRLDQVTLNKEELTHVVRAIDLLKDRIPSVSYPRYVADSGTVAFECPNATSCNLEVLARDRAQPREIEVTVHETVSVPVAVAATAVIPEKPSSSIYEELGLMNGDVLTAINGESTSSPTGALKALNQYAGRIEQIHEVSILRNGKPMQLSFNRH